MEEEEVDERDVRWGSIVAFIKSGAKLLASPDDYLQFKFVIGSGRDHTQRLMFHASTVWVALSC